MYQTLILYHLRLPWPHLSPFPTSAGVVTRRAPTGCTDCDMTTHTLTELVRRRACIAPECDTQVHIPRGKNLLGPDQLSAPDTVNYRLGSMA